MVCYRRKKNHKIQHRFSWKFLRILLYWTMCKKGSVTMQVRQRVFNYWPCWHTHHRHFNAVLSTAIGDSHTSWISDILYLSLVCLVFGLVYLVIGTDGVLGRFGGWVSTPPGARLLINYWIAETPSLWERVPFLISQLPTIERYPPPLRLPQVLIKPRKTTAVHWRQREGGLLSLVNQICSPTLTIWYSSNWNGHGRSLWLWWNPSSCRWHLLLSRPRHLRWTYFQNRAGDRCNKQFLEPDRQWNLPV